MKKRTALLVFFVFAACLFALVLHRLRTIERFESKLEVFMVEEVIRIQQQWYKHKVLPDEYLVARQEHWRLRIGRLTLWEGEYFSAWQIKEGKLRSVTRDEWAREVARDYTIVWKYTTRPVTNTQTCVGLEGIEPKRFSLDGITNRVGSTVWILNHGESSWQLQRAYCMFWGRELRELFWH